MTSKKKKVTSPVKNIKELAEFDCNLIYTKNVFCSKKKKKKQLLSSHSDEINAE